MPNNKKHFKKLPPATRKLIESLNTPDLIQQYVNEKITYDPSGEYRTFQQIVDEGKGDCYMGALFACACLLYHGYIASVNLLGAREDECHVLAVYKTETGLGSLAQSKFQGLKIRQPMYPTLRDLVVSYLESYFSFAGKYSLISFTELIDLDKYKFQWLYDREAVKKLDDELMTNARIELIKSDAKFFDVHPERYWSEVRIIPGGVKIPKKYLKSRPKNSRM